MSDGLWIHQSEEGIPLILFLIPDTQNLIPVTYPHRFLWYIRSEVHLYDVFSSRNGRISGGFVELWQVGIHFTRAW